MNTYSSYKDSGVEWIGDIPSEWDSLKLKYIFSEKPITHNTELNCGSISFGRVVFKDNDKVPISTKKSYQEVLEGEYLINPLNLNYDLKSLRIGLSDIDVVVSSGYIVIKNRIEISKSYYKWLLHIYDILHMKLLGSGVRQTISFNHISNSILTYPPLHEQQQISDYLDYKTLKIDTLIEKTQQKIELLKEQRTSLINTTVTKGLDPNVEMKDSGVEWIGDVPVGWDIKPMYTRYSQNKTKNDNSTSTILSLSYGRLIKRNMETNFGLLPDNFDSYQLLETGFIILRMTDLQNDHKSLRVGICEFQGIITSAYIGLKPLTNVCSKYFFYYLYMCDLKKVFYGLGGGLRQSVSYNDFKRFPLSIPPLQEQQQIVDYINKKTSKIDKLVDIESKRIDLLKEYRQSLISEVVTGKVDVRDEVLV